MNIRAYIYSFAMIALCSCESFRVDKIPFEDALRSANVVQTSLGDYDNNGFVVGNGDLYCVVNTEGKDIVATLFKSDVWDLRMETKDDPILPSVNVKDQRWTKTKGAKASWKNYKYPNQFSFAQIAIDREIDVKRATLDLERSFVDVDGVKIRTLMNENVYLIESKEPVSLVPTRLSILPKATIKRYKGVSYIEQIFPGDQDYDGMSVVVALATEGDYSAVAAVSSLESDDMVNDAVEMAKDIVDNVDSNIAKHESGWRSFWSESGVRIADKDLQNWWYRMLHYFRCYASENGVAAGLCAGATTPGWHGSYKINYNSWQTYWTPFNYNHPRLVRPWVEHLYQQLPRARWFADAAYGCTGAAFHSDTWPRELDPALCNSKNRRQITYMPWAYTMGMSGMAIQNLWNYYLYDPDEEYLKNRIYPVVKEVAEFYNSFISQCKLNDDGKVLLGPSYNPEHGKFGTYSNPYDLTYVRLTLNAAIEFSEVLGVDKTLRDVWRTNYERLVPFYTVADPDQNGALIVRDAIDLPYGTYKHYNITTPVVPLFPGDQVSYFSDDETKEILRNSINFVADRHNRNNSMIMLNVARARLSMTEQWLPEVKEWFKEKELPNGLFYWLGHGEYLTEQTALGSLINEGLMQSVDDIIRIFPSWSKSIDAEFDSLRAQRGFLISGSQIGGNIGDVKIQSLYGGKIQILMPAGWSGVSVDGTSRYEVKDNIITFETVKGGKYKLTNI